MDLAAIVGLNVLSGIASLVLISLGLAIIFGMMKIINLAHGEFLMLGAYATVLATNHGVNIWLAMLVIAPVFVGLVGILVERLLDPLPLRAARRHDAGDLGPQPLHRGPRHHHLR